MLLMQYEITLPADYDMGIIEHRVATRSHATDDFPHLGVKAYAVRRIGRHGSAVNAYAPLYLWNDPAGMNAFLYGPFSGIVTDFGRPAVRTWVGTSFRRGAGDAAPVFATRHVSSLAVGVPPPEFDLEGAHSQAVGVDASRWEVVRFTLWSQVPREVDPAATAFDILHVSAPELAALPQGRLW
ncbi:DUF4865 family protein [Actinoplanes sp. TFC3]|uniref:DUF4865 family protein n=1 Tax=Actinoplanes sp. TFC3 TaxID=1710355 RepID=UPI00082EC7EF|nr:DUF4865 family protein [Actinoplanes sp. TFC3]